MPDGPAWGPPAGSVSVSLPEALPPTRAAADTVDRPLRLDPPVEDRLEGDADSGDASPPSPSSCSTPLPFKPPVSTCVPPLGSLPEMLAISSLFFPFSAPLAPPSAVGGRSGSAGSISVAGARKRALPLAAWPPLAAGSSPLSGATRISTLARREIHRRSSCHSYRTRGYTRGHAPHSREQQVPPRARGSSSQPPPLKQYCLKKTAFLAKALWTKRCHCVGRGRG